MMITDTGSNEISAVAAPARR